MVGCHFLPEEELIELLSHPPDHNSRRKRNAPSKADRQADRCWCVALQTFRAIHAPWPISDVPTVMTNCSRLEPSNVCGGLRINRCTPRAAYCSTVALSTLCADVMLIANAPSSTGRL